MPATKYNFPKKHDIIAS